MSNTSSEIDENDSIIPATNLLGQEDMEPEAVVMDHQLAVECEVAINLEEENHLQGVLSSHSNSENLGATENVETSSVKEEDNAQYRCFHCAFECQEWPVIEEHYKSHNLEVPAGNECESVPVTKNEDSEDENSSFSCIICSFTTEDEYVLKEHIIANHSDVAPFLCAECNKVFNIKRSFSNHLLLHTGDNPYKCPHCTFCCKLRKYLRTHINTMHSGSRRYSCRSCSFTTKKKCDLVKHANTHATRKRFRCEICPYVSRSEEYLKRHQLIHKGILPLRCNTCDFQCVSKLLLRTHYVNHHATEKQYARGTCELRFKHPFSLKRRMTTHSDNNFFSCPLCDYICSRRDDLRSHVFFAHNDSKPFVCDRCGFRCKVKAALNFHKKFHDPKRPFDCSICGYRFLTESNLRKHETISHSSERSFSCPKCFLKSETRSELNSHINYCHGTNYPFGCYLCPFVCKKQSTFITHLKKHNTGKPNQCKVCNQKFVRANELQRHLVSHARHIYSCNFCSFYTNLKKKYSDHIQRHCESGVETDKISSGASRISIHIDSAAEKPVVKSEKEFTSSEDDESDYAGIKVLSVVDDEVKAVYFKDDIKVIEHEASSGNKASSKSYGYQCPQCNMTFMTTGQLKLHSKVHIPVKIIVCPVCDANFESRADLKDHMTIIHTDYKPYRCEICNINFRLKTNLTQHSVIHSDEKPYMCSLCDYRAKLKETLKRHYVTHSSEKPYKCSICSYSCKLKEKLKRHNLIHSSVKPFTCDQCNYSCKSKELLKRHLVVHYREQKKNAKPIKKEIKKRKSK